NKRHGVPRQIDRSLARARFPVPRFAGFAGAVRTHEDRLVASLGEDFVVGAELHPGVLWVAIKLDWAGAWAQPRGEFDQLTAGHVIHCELALLVGEDLLVLAVPTDGQPMPPQHGAGFAGKETIVRLVGAVCAMPGVCGLAIAIADA